MRKERKNLLKVITSNLAVLCSVLLGVTNPAPVVGHEGAQVFSAWYYHKPNELLSKVIDRFYRFADKDYISRDEMQSTNRKYNKIIFDRKWNNKKDLDRYYIEFPIAKKYAPLFEKVLKRKKLKSKLRRLSRSERRKLKRSLIKGQVPLVAQTQSSTRRSPAFDQKEFENYLPKDYSDSYDPKAIGLNETGETQARSSAKDFEFEASPTPDNEALESDLAQLKEGEHPASRHRREFTAKRRWNVEGRYLLSQNSQDMLFHNLSGQVVEMNNDSFNPFGIGIIATYQLQSPGMIEGEFSYTQASFDTLPLGFVLTESYAVNIFDYSLTYLLGGPKLGIGGGFSKVTSPILVQTGTGHLIAEGLDSYGIHAQVSGLIDVADLGHISSRLRVHRSMAATGPSEVTLENTKVWNVMGELGVVRPNFFQDFSLTTGWAST